MLVMFALMFAPPRHHFTPLRNDVTTLACAEWPQRLRRRRARAVVTGTARRVGGLAAAARNANCWQTTGISQPRRDCAWGAACMERRTLRYLNNVKALKRRKVRLV